ncbi:MAG: hypothetical protein GXP29_13900 [Planctomycetes bacterium]|nr:hypothetical protein [Planctomycetota bacterium]
MRFLRLFHPHLIVLFVAFCGLPVWAQSGADLSPGDEFLKNVREGEPAAADDKSFDERISTELKRLNDGAGGADVVARQTAAVFVKRFRDQYNNPKNSDGFKDKLAERASLKFLEQFNRGAELEAAAARAMAAVLSQFGSVFARDALLAGLNSSDQVVRYRSARGMENIIDGVSADARLTEVSLNAIAKVTAKETNPVVAQAMYEAMQYGKEHTDKVLAALMIALDGRLAEMRKSIKSVDAAESTTLKFLSGINGLSGDDKVEIVKRVGPLLRLLVEAYSELPQNTESEPRRDALEQAIVLAEELLESFVSPKGKAPSIRSKMAKGGDSVAIDMQIELLLWIGNEQDAGILNSGPWNVPAGAP